MVASDTPTSIWRWGILGSGTLSKRQNQLRCMQRFSKNMFLFDIWDITLHGFLSVSGNVLSTQIHLQMVFWEPSFLLFIVGKKHAERVRWKILLNLESFLVWVSTIYTLPTTWHISSQASNTQIFLIIFESIWIHLSLTMVTLNNPQGYWLGVYIRKKYSGSAYCWCGISGMGFLSPKYMLCITSSLTGYTNYQTLLAMQDVGWCWSQPYIFCWH